MVKILDRKDTGAKLFLVFCRFRFQNEQGERAAGTVIYRVIAFTSEQAQIAALNLVQRDVLPGFTVYESETLHDEVIGNVDGIAESIIHGK